MLQFLIYLIICKLKFGAIQEMLVPSPDENLSFNFPKFKIIRDPNTNIDMKKPEYLEDKINTETLSIAANRHEKLFWLNSPGIVYLVLQFLLVGSLFFTEIYIAEFFISDNVLSIMMLLIILIIAFFNILIIAILIKGFTVISNVIITISYKVSYRYNIFIKYRLK